MHYCDFAASKPLDNVHRIYHDVHYGTPIADDNELFGRLILEINQAGLSWELMLKRQDNFRKSFDNFSIEKVAKYSETKVEELVLDAGIIRNRLKINAVIHNAQQITQLQQEYGTFKGWLDHQGEKTREEWTKLFKKTFKFVGGEIVNEFLMSTGYLPGAHHDKCYRYLDLKNEKQ